jgi:hypothetical protein
VPRALFATDRPVLDRVAGIDCDQAANPKRSVEWTRGVSPSNGQGSCDVIHASSAGPLS